MDWTAAVEKNREALKRVLAMLVAMAGLGGQFPFFQQNGGGGSGVARAEKSKPSPALPRRLHRAVLRLLRPAEAAARRLIIVAARGLALPPPRPRQPATPGRPPRNPGPRALPLFDRLSPWRVRARPARSGVPRISVPGYSEPFPIALRRPDDPVDTTRLAARLAALAAALDDLPAQARRFARWRARATAASALSRMGARPPLTPPHKGEGNPAAWPSSDHGGLFTTPRKSRPGEGSGVGVARRRASHPASQTKTRSLRLWPLRPGRPPGWRRKPVHEVHDVLDVVHGLAIWALNAPDTS